MNRGRAFQKLSRGLIGDNSIAAGEHQERRRVDVGRTSRAMRARRSSAWAKRIVTFAQRQRIVGHIVAPPRRVGE